MSEHSNIASKKIDNDFQLEDYNYYEPEPAKHFCQWNRRGSTFIPCSETCDHILPGYYNISEMDGQVFFNRINFSLHGLIDFPRSNAHQIIEDIKTFWTKKASYEEYKIPFKRGIFMSGPQGTGKTSVIKIIMMNIIQAGGICIRFDHSRYFDMGMRALRSIQPELPVLVIMEDFDELISHNSRSEVLNLLDGTSSFGDIVFLATTNEPDSIPDNMLNRPGRFARHFVIDLPCEEIRRNFITTKLKPEDLGKISLDKWVDDTKGFSIDHIKALVEQVIIMDHDYDEAISQLRAMRSGVVDGSDDADDPDDPDDAGVPRGGIYASRAPLVRGEVYVKKPRRAKRVVSSVSRRISPSSPRTSGWKG